MRIFLFLLLLTTLHTRAQKAGAPMRLMYNISLSVDHISFTGNSKYRPKHASYSGRKHRGGWAVSGGIDIPFCRESSGHFKWYQGLRAGYLSNPGFQQAWRLYTETLVRISNVQMEGAFLQTGLQAGYMRSFPAGGMIRKQEDKIAVSRSGRNQFTVGFHAGAGYLTNGKSFRQAPSVQYQLWFQGPFIPGLANLLPHESISFSNSVNQKYE